MDIYTTIICSSVVFPFAFSFYLNFTSWNTLLPLFAISSISFFLTLRLIPTIKQMTKAAGLFGKDLNKQSSKEM
jgi:hypothetical protein